jgi:hypothetical protein
MIISIGYCISHSQITIEINGNVVIEQINNNENSMYEPQMSNDFAESAENERSTGTISANLASYLTSTISTSTKNIPVR